MGEDGEGVMAPIKRGSVNQRQDKVMTEFEISHKLNCTAAIKETTGFKFSLTEERRRDVVQAAAPLE